MVEIKKIAVPIDFTDVAPFIAKYAKEFAKKLDAEIVLYTFLKTYLRMKGSMLMLRLLLIFLISSGLLI